MIEQLIKPMLRRSPAVLRQAGRVLSQYGSGIVQDLSHLRDNALILSSALMVAGRIGVARHTAQRAEGTKDEQYRHMEFLKTASREIGGFALSYLVLRAAQRGLGMGLGNLLGAKSLSKMSTSPFPGLGKTLSRLGGVAKSWVTGKPLPKIDAISMESAMQWQDKLSKIALDPAKSGRVDMLKPVINGVHKLFGGAHDASMPEKVQSFIKWASLLTAAVPSVGLSGFWLESYSKRKANTLFAKKGYGNNETANNEPAAASLPVASDFGDEFDFQRTTPSMQPVKAAPVTHFKAIESPSRMSVMSYGNTQQAWTPSPVMPTPWRTVTPNRSVRSTAMSPYFAQNRLAARAKMAANPSLNYTAYPNVLNPFQGL